MTLRRSLMASLLVNTLLLSACTNVGYYWQSTTGHLQIMRQARPVADLLVDKNTPDLLKNQLRLSQQIRDFASAELHLPRNASYRRYADIRRSAAVWNVVATPALSLSLKTWCFIVVGCVGYRGYYDETQARDLAAQLKTQGLDTNVYGVRAYSTLGWMNWLGGDPLLSSMINYPEVELARIIFHELAHQVVYVNDDTEFNESFAVTVERLGVRRWLTQQGKNQVLAAVTTTEQQHQAFVALRQKTQHLLAAIYNQYDQHNLSEPLARKAKVDTLKNFATQYAELKIKWYEQSGANLRTSGYDRWVAEANNASFAIDATYDDLVPKFEALYARDGANWDRFYEAVKSLATLPKTQRHSALQAL